MRVRVSPWAPRNGTAGHLLSVRPFRFSGPDARKLPRRGLLHRQGHPPRASTLPGEFYADPGVFEALRSKVLARSWQLAGSASQLPGEGSVCPAQHLDEPLVLTR